jgi:hypothetical protein
LTQVLSVTKFFTSDVLGFVFILIQTKNQLPHVWQWPGQSAIIRLIAGRCHCPVGAEFSRLSLSTGTWTGVPQVPVLECFLPRFKLKIRLLTMKNKPCQTSPGRRKPRSGRASLKNFAPLLKMDLSFFQSENKCFNYQILTTKTSHM